MKRKAHICLSVLLCLVLSACADRDGGSYLGQAARLKDTETILTVDGREVPAWQYLYWLSRACAQAEGVDWSGMTEDGETPTDYLRQQALADTILCATVENWAALYDCVPTEKTVPDSLWMAEAAACGLDAVCAQSLSDTGYRYGALYSLFRTEGGPLTPVAGEVEAFAEEMGYLSADRLLYSAGEDAAGAEARAGDAFAQLNAAEAQAEVFARLAAEDDDTAGTRLLLPGDGTFDPALETALSALAVGQYSGIIETEEGFSILRRLPVAGDALAGAYFDHLLQSAAAQASVALTEAYRKLDPAAFYRRLTALREQG